MPHPAAAVRAFAGRRGRPSRTPAPASPSAWRSRRRCRRTPASAGRRRSRPMQAQGQPRTIAALFLRALAPVGASPRAPPSSSSPSSMASRCTGSALGARCSRIDAIVSKQAPRPSSWWRIALAAIYSDNRAMERVKVVTLRPRCQREPGFEPVASPVAGRVASDAHATTGMLLDGRSAGSDRAESARRSRVVELGREAVKYASADLTHHVLTRQGCLEL